MVTILESVKRANKKSNAIKWQPKPLFRVPFTRYFVAKWRYWRNKRIFIIVRKEFKDGRYYYEEV